MIIWQCEKEEIYPHRNIKPCNAGLISHIQRFSVHDGPGIRDLIFIKGCPLRCQWCSNPETQNRYAELTYNENRCIGPIECGRCVKVCEVGAIKELGERRIGIDRKLCSNCGKCVEVCVADSLKLFGNFMSIDNILKIVEEDSAFYTRSEGGITVSGGDPLSQAEFVRDLLEECHRYGIDTAIETSGYGEWEDIENVCTYANLIFYDIKCMDSKKHRAFTGVANELILENLKKLSTCFRQTPIIVRTPIIPGFNNSEGDIEAIVDFLTEINNLKEYELLPYHGFGEPKYLQLGRKYLLSGFQAPSEKEMSPLRSVARRAATGSRADRRPRS